MPREALRQQLDELYREISNCKILAENFENHPCVTNQMMAKNPVANLRIPAKLFVLWSELKSIQVPAPTCVDLVRYNLLLLYYIIIIAKLSSGLAWKTILALQCFQMQRNLKRGFARNAAERARSTEVYVGITPRKDWERVRNASSYMPTRVLCNRPITSPALSPALQMNIVIVYQS